VLVALISCIFYNQHQLADDDTALPAEERRKQQAKRGLPHPINSSVTHPMELRRRSSTERKIFSRERSNSFKTEAQLRALQNSRTKVVFVYFASAHLRVAMQSSLFATKSLSS
jgi:hypothetical protein